jgi:hypothetical protein
MRIGVATDRGWVRVSCQKRGDLRLMRAENAPVSS